MGLGRYIKSAVKETVRVSKRKVRDAPGAAKRKLQEAPGNVAHNVGERIKTARQTAREERAIYKTNYKMARRDAIAKKARADAKRKVMKGGGGLGGTLGDIGTRAQRVNQYMTGGVMPTPFGIGKNQNRSRRKSRSSRKREKRKRRTNQRRRQQPQTRSLLF